MPRRKSLLQILGLTKARKVSKRSSRKVKRRMSRKRVSAGQASSHPSLYSRKNVNRRRSLPLMAKKRVTRKDLEATRRSLRMLLTKCQQLRQKTNNYDPKKLAKLSPAGKQLYMRSMNLNARLTMIRTRRALLARRKSPVKRRRSLVKKRRSVSRKRKSPVKKRKSVKRRKSLAKRR